jgi:hypothetical protein
MESTAFWISISVAMLLSLFVAVLLPLFLSGERSRAAQDKARARRLAEARMNARLLRLDI